MSKYFEYVKLNLERTTQGLLAKKSEFIYADNESRVPVNKTYSAYYLTDKNKLYFTNLITSKYVRQLFKVKDFDLYEQYAMVSTVDREVYPNTIKPEINDKDYNRGFINRFFIQKANDKNAAVLEISESDYNKKLNMYNKTKVIWKLSGDKDTVIDINSNVILSIQREYGLQGLNIFPLQYWRPSKGTPQTLEKKLSLLKTN